MQRDPLLLNKILAALLAALLVATMSTFFAQIIYGEEHADENEPVALALVDIDDEQGASAGSTAEESASEEVVPFAKLLANADVTHGKALAKKCSACHTFTSSGANRIGPNLWKISNRAVAKVAGFKYSSAMKEFGGAWTNERLDKFITKPKNAIAGTKMNFVGIRKPQDRADLIAWLKTLE